MGSGVVPGQISVLDWIEAGIKIGCTSIVTEALPGQLLA
jgi:hypothetical protein